MTLPDRLSERARPLNDAPVDASGAFVLCWLHHAVRDHENPVLDVAVETGNALGRPVLVYQGLGGRHRFNSDRHHAFILQGARDLARGLAARGLAYSFRLPADPSAPSPLRTLLADACALVTEDFPAPPFPAWTRRLADRAACAALAVDGACLMPMRRPGRRFARAFEFREAARDEWRARIAQAWPDVEPAVEPLRLDAGRLGFSPLDLRAADLDALCARCDIDHAVPPVRRTPGGSSAGYERWAAFRDAHLRRYDGRRNDATDLDAVSGLSPYLHHGHVSPFRIAREAHEVGGRGAEKFLDELLVWRELAFNFCAFTSDEALETLEALPSWARRTLDEHAADARGTVHSWETLSRGATGDELWDAAQHSLVLNGELHNNVRMTWGKMIPRWTRSPAEALQRLVELNHRHALDGSDPGSYGGLLWCLGRFDRPFPPARAVLGTVRDRSTDSHVRRLDPARYAAAVRARVGVEGLRVAVVGAGVSGLACARLLRDQACEVVVFDRGRGPGGRLSSRRIADPGDRPTTFDHGAPFFRLSDERFARHARSWIEDGACAWWEPDRAVWRRATLRPVGPTPLVVGTPAMSGVCRHLAAGLDVRSGATVTELVRDGRRWRLSVERGGPPGSAGEFDAVVVAAPSRQAARLVSRHSRPIADALAELPMRPAWVAMIRVDEAPDGLPDVVEARDDAALELLVRDDAKPGRSREPGRARWVVHATPAWSARRYDVPREQLGPRLLRETVRLLAEMAGPVVDAERVTLVAAHRWGVARPVSPRWESCVFDPVARLAVCGDGLGGSGVEAAFLGGQAAAARVLTLRPARRRAARCDAAQDTLFGPQVR